MTRPELYQYVTDYFKATMPAPKTELHYENPFQLVVAVRRLNAPTSASIW